MKKKGNKKMPTPRYKLIHNPIPTSEFCLFVVNAESGSSSDEESVSSAIIGGVVAVAIVLIISITIAIVTIIIVLILKSRREDVSPVTLCT